MRVQGPGTRRRVDEEVFLFFSRGGSWRPSLFCGSGVVVGPGVGAASDVDWHESRWPVGTLDGLGSGREDGDSSQKYESGPVLPWSRVEWQPKGH